MRLKLFSVLILVFSLLICFSCSSSTDSNDETNFELIQPTLEANALAAKGKPITAQVLFDNMNDGNTANDYFVLSVRAADAYALGHIPGAINIPWRSVAKDASLAQLPKDKTIAVYCYTGHTGQAATTALVNMGYDAVNVKYGFMSWTQDATARVQGAFSEDVDAHDFAIETTANAGGNFDLPDPEFLDSQDAEKVMQAAADNYLSNHAPVISAQSLFDNLNDGNTANDPQVVSVRSDVDYAKGHIPGAINIPWKTIANIENLKKLDPTREIVVYCYTGHTAQIAATVLNMLGYDALNMKHGMMAWTKDATVRVHTAFTEGVDSHDYAFTTGTNP